VAWVAEHNFLNRVDTIWGDLAIKNGLFTQMIGLIRMGF
jgi:hypothetical protein